MQIYYQLEPYEQRPVKFVCSGRHDDVIKWEKFSALLTLCERNHRSSVDPLTKASDAELWCILWSVPEQTVEQTIETLVIWDAFALIMTSLLRQWDKSSPFMPHRRMFYVNFPILRIYLNELISRLVEMSCLINVTDGKLVETCVSHLVRNNYHSVHQKRISKVTEKWELSCCQIFRDC